LQSQIKITVYILKTNAKHDMVWRAATHCQRGEWVKGRTDGPRGSQVTP